MKKILTLCIVVKDKEILLGMKKRGFGAGLWNGFGGKVEEGETIEQAAIRELTEECKIDAVEVKKTGIIEFTFQDSPKILEVHIFKVVDFTGKPVETEEMKPKWFGFENIPYSQMWSSDIHWLPLLLHDKLFTGSFLFDRPSDAEYSAKIITQELNIVESL
jgi:8-oxo-dGTP diphosphatase/2-hydroxy-dATP diphosphatase